MTDALRLQKRDRRVDDYLAKAPPFARPILTHIRKLVHAACPEVEEAIKWSMPFFLHKGMLCHMAAFKNHCALGFWRSRMVVGEDGQSENADSAMGQFGPIKSIADLPDDEKLTAYIKKAVALNEAGVKRPARPRPAGDRELTVPEFFAAALKKNKKALAAFENFSYSHKKEYVAWVAEAKREETRQKRLATTLSWLAEGKTRHWKYAGC
jgi:uncharacterized protein YdeI (YjbR/CyaY-like superfamily)